MKPTTVTAVMVTGHNPRRQRLARLTAQAFPRQTYPHAELLIVNQGSSPLFEEPPARVREVMDGAGLVVGALRNLAWRFATSELMTCWDDDDVHHPQRIALQVSRFRDRPVALQYELYLHLGTGEAFAYRRSGGFENSLLWPRDCTSRYAERPRGEDACFFHALARELGIHRIDNPPSLYVRIFHGQNVWHEDHFFGEPQRAAADPRNQHLHVRPPTEEERGFLDRLLPEYRKAAP